MAALISLRSDIVSIQMRSTPPATSDAACSRKTSTASSYSSVPSGATISPLGPMSPATRASPPAASGPRARRRMAAVRLSSSTRSWRPCRRQPQAVAAERVGQDDARAGGQVAALDPAHDIRVGQVPGLRRVAELESGREEHRAHRPVGQDRTALVEERPESGAGRPAVDGPAGGEVREEVRIDRSGIDRRPAGVRRPRDDARPSGSDRCDAGDPSPHDTHHDRSDRRPLSTPPGRGGRCRPGGLPRGRHGRRRQPGHHRPRRRPCPAGRRLGGHRRPTARRAGDPVRDRLDRQDRSPRTSSCSWRTEGRLAVDDPVVRHLPWFRVPRTGDRITLHHLLSHTGGITAGVDGTPEATFQVWRLRDLPPGVGARPALPLLERRVQGARPGHRGHRGRGVPARSIRRRVLEPLGMARQRADHHRRHPARAWPSATSRRSSERPWTTGDPIAPATVADDRHGGRGGRRDRRGHDRAASASSWATRRA